MEPWAILMLCFSAALFLYAALLAITGDYGMIPRGHAARVRDKRAYARAFAKAIALVAVAPLASAVFSLFSTPLAVVALLGNAAAAVWLAAQFFEGL